MMFDKLYNDIGGKIKIWAKVSFVVEALASIIAGIILMIDAEYYGAIVYILFFLGPVVAWVSSWLLYGFGELIDKAREIAINTSGGKTKSATQSKIDQGRISKLEKLRAQGLITEEEYQNAITKGNP